MDTRAAAKAAKRTEALKSKQVALRTQLIAARAAAKKLCYSVKFDDGDADARVEREKIKAPPLPEEVIAQLERAKQKKAKERRETEEMLAAMSKEFLGGGEDVDEENKRRLEEKLVEDAEGIMDVCHGNRSLWRKSAFRYKFGGNDGYQFGFGVPGSANSDFDFGGSESEHVDWKYFSVPMMSFDEQQPVKIHSTQQSTIAAADQPMEIENEQAADASASPAASASSSDIVLVEVARDAEHGNISSSGSAGKKLEVADRTDADETATSDMAEATEEEGDEVVEGGKDLACLEAKVVAAAEVAEESSGCGENATGASATAQSMSGVPEDLGRSNPTSPAEPISLGASTMSDGDVLGDHPSGSTGDDATDEKKSPAEAPASEHDSSLSGSVAVEEASCNSILLPPTAEVCNVADQASSSATDNTGADSHGSLQREVFGEEPAAKRTKIES